MAAELKTRLNDTDVDTFLAAVENPQKRADAVAVKKMMEKITRRPARMWGSSIIGFGSYEATYADGKKREWMLTGYSPRKTALTFYIMGGFDSYDELLGKLGKHSTGKACLYVKRLDDVDQKVLARLIRESVAYMRKKYPTR